MSVLSFLAARFGGTRHAGKGELSTEAIAWLATLFIGLFIISTVSDITAMANTSDFYTVFTDLVSKTATVYKVLILVLIVVLLAFAMGSLKTLGGGGQGSSMG